MYPSGYRQSAAPVRRPHMSSPSSCSHSCHLLLTPPILHFLEKALQAAGCPYCTEDTKQLPALVTSLIILTRTNWVYGGHSWRGRAAQHHVVYSKSEESEWGEGAVFCCSAHEDFQRKVFLFIPEMSWFVRLIWMNPRPCYETIQSLGINSGCWNTVTWYWDTKHRVRVLQGLSHKVILLSLHNKKCFL